MTTQQTKAKRTKPLVKESEWKSTTEAIALLEVSRDFLLRLKQSGQLKVRRHWRVKNPTAARLTYQWHVGNIERWMSEVLEA